MVTSPVMSCTIVLGIGSIRQAAKTGEIGGVALLSLTAMPTVALVIGLILATAPAPGEDLEITAQGQQAATAAAEGEGAHSPPPSSCSASSPTTLVSRIVGELVLRTLFVALPSGSPCTRRHGHPSPAWHARASADHHSDHHRWSARDRPPEFAVVPHPV